MLHSHHHTSPLSQQQEVSAYEGANSEDNWTVKCQGNEKFWLRESPVTFLHEGTGKYLTANKRHQYPYVLTVLYLETQSLVSLKSQEVPVVLEATPSGPSRKVSTMPLEQDPASKSTRPDTKSCNIKYFAQT
jgi:hypothetical protein